MADFYARDCISGNIWGKIKFMLCSHSRILKNTGRKPNVLNFRCTVPRLLYESLIEEQHNVAIHIVGLLKQLDSGLLFLCWFLGVGPFN